MRLASLHPGVTRDEVVREHGLRARDPRRSVPDTRAPTAEELRLLREVIDPDEPRDSEVRA